MLRTRRARALSITMLVGTLALLAVAGASAASFGPPKVPACFSQAGECQGIFLKSEIGATKESGNLKGIYSLTSATPLQTTKPVACGDAGCLYNHLNWVVGGGAQVLSGCQPNESTCKVKVVRGGGYWTPVVVNQNDYPTNLFLLWAPPKGTYKIAGTISSQCSSHCTARIPISNVDIKVRGSHSVSTTTDVHGDYEALVPKGSYTVAASADGIDFTPDAIKVKVAGSNETGKDFTGCAAASLGGSSSSSVRAAGSTWTLESGFPCINFVRVVYSPVTRKMSVTWKTQPLCRVLGVAPQVDAGVTAYNIFKSSPVTAPILVDAKGGVTADINDSSTPPIQKMHIALAAGGANGSVFVSGESPETHTSAPNHFTNGGGREDCYPKAETLTLKRK